MDNIGIPADSNVRKTSKLVEERLGKSWGKVLKKRAEIAEHLSDTGGKNSKSEDSENGPITADGENYDYSPEVKKVS